MILDRFNKLSLRFFYLNIISVIVFACLYWLQDVWITNNQELAEKLYLLEKNHDLKSYSSKHSSFSYYLWFSLMTQTTVGYGGPANTVTGKAVSFFEEPNRLAKLLNALQMIGILFIVSIV